MVLLASASPASVRENLFRFNDRIPGFAKKYLPRLSTLVCFFCYRISLRWLLAIFSHTLSFPIKGAIFLLLSLLLLVAYFMFMRVLPNVCLCTICVHCPQKTALDPPELEFQTISAF